MPYTCCALQRERFESLVSLLFSRYNAARGPKGWHLDADFFFFLELGYTATGLFAIGLFRDWVINSQR